MGAGLPILSWDGGGVTRLGCGKRATHGKAPKDEDRNKTTEEGEGALLLWGEMTPLKGGFAKEGGRIQDTQSRGNSQGSKTNSKTKRGVKRRGEASANCRKRKQRVLNEMENRAWGKVGQGPPTAKNFIADSEEKFCRWGLGKFQTYF